MTKMMCSTTAMMVSSLPTMVLVSFSVKARSLRSCRPVLLRSRSTQHPQGAECESAYEQQRGLLSQTTPCDCRSVLTSADATECTVLPPFRPGRCPSYAVQVLSL